MTRCMFCDNSFTDLDEVYSHQVTLTSSGKSICSKLTPIQDSQELFPQKVEGRKYAPKDHNGRFIVFTSKGQLAKDPTKTGKNYIHYHLLHGLSPILNEEK